MLVLSTDDFETFYGAAFGLDRQSFVAGYRNDWSWQYARLLLDAGLEPIIAVRSLGQPETFRTEEGVVVRSSRWVGSGGCGGGTGGRLPPWNGRGRPAPRKRSGRSPPRGSALAAVGAAMAAGASPAEALRGRDPLCHGIAAEFQTGCADVVYVQEYWTAQFDLIARSGRPQGAPKSCARPARKPHLVSHLTIYIL
jgi:hypothetical protein